MITVSELSKAYRGFTALDDISFTIKPREVVSIIGPSGSGKSTLLRTLNLLVLPDAGQITIGDESVNAKNLHRININRLRRKTSMVFQHYNLFRNKTALENITEVLRFARKLGRKEADEKALEYLNRVGLHDKASSYPAMLSGGQQQRVGIARALSLEPEVILMDEPTSSLDPEMRRGILKLIAEIASQNITMAIVTHEMNFARDISNRLFFMDQGKLIAQGTPDEIIHGHAGGRIDAFVNDFEI
ncbi:amino acid ABC transporter ATP-binding protein [Pantoea sp. DY-15]|uniref:amino acid ABC transporter ATP-binding protein n=1 Tax=Pantoea sp. DY-15 TaxID=2871489 RepID=UPI001C943B2D|nr:amino acid ABC transporter ATP-binding protein [Pantoea sp. DY-15]MBY4890707.1 amino acid ABC transporter ATP-binding protein [Pantoea sp. DY-15]